MNLDKLPEGIANMIRAIADKPDFPERLARLALFLKQTKHGALFQELALHARKLAPDSPRVRYLTYPAVRQAAPPWHFAIVGDSWRNEIYARALQQFVRPGMLVLEIGAGTGLLAMLAAKAGAQVITCERAPLIAERAQTIVAHNGLAERVTVIPKELSALRIGFDLPRRADILVAEIVDNHLLGESVLPLYAHACRNLLASSARVLPANIAARGMLVGGLAAGKNRMGEVMGFDLSPFNVLSPSVLNSGAGGGEFVAHSDPIEVFRFDLKSSHHPERESRQLQVDVTQGGVVQGFMQWNWMDFGAGITLENCPPLKSCWWPIVHLFSEEIKVTTGEFLSLTVEHDQERVMIYPERRLPCVKITRVLRSPLCGERRRPSPHVLWAPRTNSASRKPSRPCTAAPPCSSLPTARRPYVKPIRLSCWRRGASCNREPGKHWPRSRVCSDNCWSDLKRNESSYD